MRIYIAGPMTGKPGWNYAAFIEAAAMLREGGYDVVDTTDDAPPADSMEWDGWLRRAIGLLLTCEAIFMLSGWEASKGARLERHIASELGMAVYGDMGEGVEGETA